MGKCTNKAKTTTASHFFSPHYRRKSDSRKGKFLLLFFLVLCLNGGVVKETDNRFRRMKARAGLHHKDLLSGRKRIPVPALPRFCSNASLSRCCVTVPVFTAPPSVSLRTKRREQTTRQKTDSKVFYTGLASNTAPAAAFDKQKALKCEYEMTCRPNREKQTAFLSDTSLQKGQA